MQQMALLDLPPICNMWKWRVELRFEISAFNSQL